MGQVIRVDNIKGDLPSALTETGAGGLLSSGYLRNAAAVESLRTGEVPVFVLTNEKRGVERRVEGTDRHHEPGDGYRTIAVVTDQRLVVLVGDAGPEGDRSFAVDLVDVRSVSTDGRRRGGQITVVHGEDDSTTVYCGGRGLDEAAEYVRTASQAWIHVENRFDAVTARLDEATAQCDAGEYDDALESARLAVEETEDPGATASSLAEEWGGGAITRRVESVRSNCRDAVAHARLGRARAFADEGEARRREDAYEAAHDAYDRAEAEYEAVLSTDADLGPDVEAVRAERVRLERAVERLEVTPIRRADAAARIADDADDAATAADRWEAALDHYRTALELDWGAEERRFDGDPADVRDRLGDVVERAVSARRSAATEARDAGDWYVGAEQYDVATEEFETARDQYDRAIAVARDGYSDALDHLSVERESVVERIERARAMRDGEPHQERATADEPEQDVQYDVDAAIGTEANDGENPVTDGTSTSESTDEDVDDGIEARLRRLDEADFVNVVETVLVETGWTTDRPTADEPYDVRAVKETPVEERMSVVVEHRPDGTALDQSAVESCASVGGHRSDGSVMIATSAAVTDEATRHARRRQVRLLDDEYLSTVIEAREMEPVLADRRLEAE